MASRARVVLLMSLFLVSCRDEAGPISKSQEPKDLIVGYWTGRAHNPGGKEAPGMEFEFEFRGDGTFRMGKGKVWVSGKYKFLEAKKFELNIKKLDAGPYDVVEATPTRFVYERKLNGDRVQRTELTRQP